MVESSVRPDPSGGPSRPVHSRVFVRPADWWVVGGAGGGRWSGWVGGGSVGWSAGVGGGWVGGWWWVVGGDHSRTLLLLDVLALKCHSDVLALCHSTRSFLSRFYEPLF